MGITGSWVGLKSQLVRFSPFIENIIFNFDEDNQLLMMKVYHVNDLLKGESKSEHHSV